MSDEHAIATRETHYAARSDFPAKGQWRESRDALGVITGAYFRCPGCGLPTHFTSETIDDDGQIGGAPSSEFSSAKCGWRSRVILVGWSQLE